MTKVVVIGGTGLIGSKLVAQLKGQGNEAIPASPNSGVNTLTGQGLAEVLTDAEVVVDVSNSPSFEEAEVLSFFTTSTTNLLAAAAAAGVAHYVALSVVGTQRLSESPYFRAKIAQENLIKEYGSSYTIAHATQFFEFLRSIANAATVDGEVHVSPVLIQPMAADDVARAVAGTATSEPINGTVEVAGPEQFRLDELISNSLAREGQSRTVVTDPQARYFGAPLQERTLLPETGALIYHTRYQDWVARSST